MRNVFLVSALLAALLFGLVPRAEALPTRDALGPTGAGQRTAPGRSLAPSASLAAPAEISAEKGALIQYSLPVTPTHLLAGSDGLIWYSSFFGHAIGSLDPMTLVSRVYRLPEEKSVSGITEDLAGNVWYATVNAVNGNDGVGRLDPLTGLISEWILPRNHFGLEIDPVTQAAWFVSKGAPIGQLGRLTPQTNQLTLWNINPYTDTYDIDLSSNGDVWFTVQPRGMQGLGRLKPASSEVTIWKLPSPVARPFQLSAVGPDEIWLTEFDPAGNSVSRFTPSSNTLSRYPLPAAEGGPAGISKTGDRVWFTQYLRSKVGYLEPALATAEVATLQAENYVAPSLTSTLAPAVIAPELLKSASAATQITLPGARSGGFTEFALPATDGQPFDIAAVDAATVWFTETGGLRISRLQVSTVETNFKVLLPTVIR